MKLYQTLEQQLKKEPNYVSDNGELKKWVVISKAQNFDEELIKLVLDNEELKTRFFKEIAGITVFNQSHFIQFLEQKNYLNDSYTQYKNKVGLTIGNKYLKQRNEVSLVWPFKDCILEGGQSREEDKREEIFFNETLAQDEITQLLEPKVLTNVQRIDQNGTHALFHSELVSESLFNRNENGTITDNLIIKGNNLLALHSLKKEFAGKVKLIYIDPPYNTGNDGFKYNDSFNHSTWLTFMKNRLHIARELLKEDGVIFVQCDDNEQAYLKVLMDEVFGRENVICDFIWQKKTGASDAKNIAIITEYSLCFAKNNQPNLFSKNTESYDYNRYKLSDEHIKERGNYYIDNLDRGGLSYSDSLNYGIKCPDGTITFPNGRKEYKKDGWIWKWGKNKVEWALKNDFLEFRKSNSKESGWAVCYKNYLLVDNKGLPIERAAPYKNLILDVLNNDAANEMKELFGKKIFSYPKPEKLLQKFISISTEENDIVLDYHLGSGTTASVAHKMDRQYIGIEQMDYIETVAVERLKKVVEGEQGGISKSVNWQGGGSFVYLELKKYNQTFIDQIQEAQNTETLLQIWEQMKAKSFLNYNVDIQKQEQHIEEFKLLRLEEQKQHLCGLLNKNQLYVNLSELDDEQFECTEEEKKITKDFYQLKS